MKPARVAEAGELHLAGEEDLPVRAVEPQVLPLVLAERTANAFHPRLGARGQRPPCAEDRVAGRRHLGAEIDFVDRFGRGLAVGRQPYRGRNWNANEIRVTRCGPAHKTTAEFPAESPKLLPSTDLVPERFELGTLPYELMAGTTAAVDFLASLGPDSLTDRRERLLAAMTLVEEHEDRLRVAIEDGLATLPGVTLRSRAKVRTPTLLLTFADREPADAYEFLAGLDINVPAGSFYAIEASRFLGLGDAGGLRVGLAPYSDRSDVDRLLAGLADFLT